MKKDQSLTRRRALLAGAAAVGAAGTAGLLYSGLSDDAPVRAAAPAAGPPPRLARTPTSYRLQPVAGYGAPHTAPARVPVRHEPFLRMSGRGNTMVLTFDDGPDPRYTPHILDTLAEYDVRATFFVCGEMADWNRDILARMSDEGHIVGNHTWSHPLLTKMTRSQIRSEMERTSDVIEDAYGERPQWFRAPTAPGTGPPSSSAPRWAWNPSPGPSTPSTGTPPASATSSTRSRTAPPPASWCSRTTPGATGPRA